MYSEWEARSGSSRPGAWHRGAAPIGIGLGTPIEVGGHAAVSLATDERPKNGWRVAWLYAPDAWVAVTADPGLDVDRPKLDQATVRDIAVRLAGGLVVGVREPLRFPFTLDAVPPGLQPIAGVSAPRSSLRQGYAAITFDDQPGMPEEPALQLDVVVGTVTNGSLRPIGPDRQVAGHHARFFHPKPGWLLLNVYGVNGYTVSLTANRTHVARLGGEGGLLALAAGIHIIPGADRDPARWTRRPLG